MRRYTIFLTEKDNRWLEKKIQGSDLGAQEYLNLVVAKFLGYPVPADKSKWRKFMDKRREKIAAEPFKAEKVGQGERYMDRIARALDQSPDPMTVEQLAKATGITPNNVGRALRRDPSVFEAVNKAGRRPFEPLQWVLLVDLN